MKVEMKVGMKVGMKVETQLTALIKGWKTEITSARKKNLSSLLRNDSCNSTMKYKMRERGTRKRARVNVVVDGNFVYCEF